jgi:superfamily II DNA or RNA helicase
VDYSEFINLKKRVWTGIGYQPGELPDKLYDWQAALVRWALKKGRAALFADCGLGKSFMQIAWANALEVPCLFLAPLCVAEQTVHEAEKLGITLRYARNDKEAGDGRLIITNYERLDAFDVSRFPAVVLDESSILKSFDGKTRTKLIQTFQGTAYRLCCTATPSPNDISELANHAEFLGLMTRAEFLATWFVHDDAGWRMKRHAVTPFYRWLASWAMALRRPSDLGYADDGFALPPLNIRERVVATDAIYTGALFPEAGLKGISGRLTARRGSMDDRIDATVDLVSDGQQWLLWCGLNEEAHALASKITGAVNVEGSDTYAEKVAAVEGFIAGKIRVLVSKPRILGFGLNFQHCHQMAFVGLGDSYEQYYQAIRRVWRFGQKLPVDAWLVVSEAERLVVENVRRKEATADALSANLLEHIRDFERAEVAA